MKYTQAVRMHKNGLLKKIPGTENFMVQEEFVWYLNYDDKRTHVIVPKGFVTNFGSIPRPIRFLFTPTRYIGYILHDRLYDRKGAIFFQDEYETHEIPYTRKQADSILKDSLQVEGAGFIERNLIYWGVRIGGFLYYKK